MAAIPFQDWTSWAKKLAPVYSRYGRWLPAIADLLLVIVIAGLLARLFWALVPVPAGAAWKPAPAAVAAPDPAQRIDLAAISAAQLFGHFQPPSATASSAIERAPPTQLDLTLLGILANGSDSSSSRALISGGSEEKPYAIGDEITQGVTLRAIFIDRVVLAREGRLETLRLNKAQASSANTGTVASAPEQEDGAEMASSLGQVRNQLLQNPGKAEDYIRVMPAQAPGGGGQLGYRIYPGKMRTLFNNTGLRPGDLVTSINGIQLNDPAKALQLLSDLSQATQVSLGVQRGGQTENIAVDIGH